MNKREKPFLHLGVQCAHQTTGQAGAGFLSRGDGMKHGTSIREHEHFKKRTGASVGKEKGG